MTDAILALRDTTQERVNYFVLLNLGLKSVEKNLRKIIGASFKTFIVQINSSVLRVNMTHCLPDKG